MAKCRGYALWRGSCNLPCVEGRARVAKSSDFRPPKDSRDLTFLFFIL